MGENCRTDDVVMTVHGVCSPQQGDARRPLRGIKRGLAVGVCQCYPVLQRRQFFIAGKRAATIEHTAETVGFDIVRCYMFDFALHHLSNFLLEGHRRQ